MFRQIVKRTCSQNKDTLVVSYSRKGLGQTGDGHYSPVGAFDEASDSLLILDVARFKYPPHWVKVKDLYESMRYLDKTTNKPRGYMLLQREQKSCVCSSLWTCVPGNTIRRLVFEITSVNGCSLLPRVRKICTLLLRSKMNLGNLLQLRNLRDSDHIDHVRRLVRSLETCKIFRFVSDTYTDKELLAWKCQLINSQEIIGGGDDVVIDLRHILSILILSLPRDLFHSVDGKTTEEDESLINLDNEKEDNDELKVEIQAIRMQIDALRRKMSCDTGGCTSNTTTLE